MFWFFAGLLNIPQKMKQLKKIGCIDDYRASDSSAYTHCGCRCKLENIFYVMLIYWLSSCKIMGVQIAVDTASPADHAHVTGQMPVD